MSAIHLSNHKIQFQDGGSELSRGFDCCIQLNMQAVFIKPRFVAEIARENM